MLQNYRAVSPLSVCAACVSRSALRVLIQHGCRVCQQDPRDGYTLLHALVALAVYEPHKEAPLMELYELIRQLIPSETIKQLLHTENNEGFRPLEFAAKEGQYGLLWAMYNTEGVYLARHEVRGGVEYKWYDITEYETYGKGQQCRWSWSPLLSIMMMDKERFTQQSTLHFLHSQFLTKWLQAKRNCTFIPILFLFFLRSIHIGVFYCYQIAVPLNDSHRNSSGESCTAIDLSGTSRLIIQAYLMMYSCCSLLFSVGMYAFYRIVHKNVFRMLYKLNGVKSLALDLNIYHFSSWVFHALVLVGAPYMHVPQSTASHLLNVCMSACLVWHILYMAQLLGSIGNFVIMMQAVMNILLQFLVVFILMCLSWMFIFQRLAVSAQSGNHLSFVPEHKIGE
jgi:hypothetical protein